MLITAGLLVEKYGLLPHPEGGYYKQTYCSKDTVPAAALPQRFTGSRYFSTAIYFLLDQGNFSAFHRIKSDECWHFYAGGTLNIYVIHPEGRLEVFTLGNDILNGAAFQIVVPAGCWFASEPATDNFSFVGCTVAPGFDFEDFELADAAALIKRYPDHEELISRLCR